MGDYQQPHRDSVDYWREVTAENQPINPKHPSAKKDVYESYLDALDIRPGQTVMDLGVGFGRFISYYLARKASVVGVDVDINMIDSARNDYAHDTCKFLCNSSTEIQVPDESIDRLVCWGVFDELNQGQSLVEMGRVMKRGALALVTGKNTLYHRDDQDALDAERGARCKNHCNFFTRFNDVDFQSFGFILKHCHYFERRGDFALNKSSDTAPARFYEYCMVLERIEGERYTQGNVPEIADAISMTWREVNEK